MDTSLTPNLNDIFAYVDDHAQAFLARLIDYLRCPSISAYGEGIGEVAEYIEGVMRQMGLEVTRFFMSIKTGAAVDLPQIGAK